MRVDGVRSVTQVSVEDLWIHRRILQITKRQVNSCIHKPCAQTSLSILRSICTANHGIYHCTLCCDAPHHFRNCLWSPNFSCGCWRCRLWVPKLVHRALHARRISTACFVIVISLVPFGIFTPVHRDIFTPSSVSALATRCCKEKLPTSEMEDGKNLIFHPPWDGR